MTRAIKAFVAQRADRRQARLESRASARRSRRSTISSSPNYFKEIFLDSDTKLACISGSPVDEPQDWFLTNDMKYAAREKINKEAGTKRMFSHAIFTAGLDGWLDKVEED